MRTLQLPTRERGSQSDVRLTRIYFQRFAIDMLPRAIDLLPSGLEDGVLADG